MNGQVNAILRAHGAGAPEAGPAGVTVVTVSAEQALGLWEALRSAFPATGKWPIIRGCPSAEIGVPRHQDLAAEVARVPPGSVRELLDNRFRDLCKDLSEIVEGLDPDEGWEAVAERVDASGVNCTGGVAPEEPWPGSREAEPVELHTTSYGRSPESRIAVALVPVRHPYAAAVVLGFGGWNDCPEPALIAATLREWDERFGAVPAAMAGDVLECIAGRPPRTKQAALSLAAEQWVFCEDIVGQGTQTVRRLGIELWRSQRWFFWWD